ncbi:MAG: serine/threonine-protein kinase [Planctomycetia bacterium]|nr:serine/threonine-protein kinase [Planctomycetia bacterium]
MDKNKTKTDPDIDTAAISSGGAHTVRVKIPDEEVSALFRTTPFQTGKAKKEFSLLSPNDFLTASKKIAEARSDPSNKAGSANSSFQPNPYLRSGNYEIPRIGKLFEFKKCIGHGGFGDVFVAFDTALQRNVAIKTLRTDKEKYSMRYRFIIEAKIAASLEHPNIIPVHGLYTDTKNQLHRVEKLIKGYDLQTILQRLKDIYNTMSHKRIVKEEANDLTARLEIFLKVCDAISYAHNKKYLHNDIKPKNVIVGRFNEIYVTDWGLAEQRVSKFSRKSNDFFGTPQYMAPEILTHHPYDSRADIYSLGVFLFNIVYLSQPFPLEIDINGLIELKTKGLLAPMKHRYGVRIPSSLNYIVHKAMAARPTERYQTVQQLADDLRIFMHGKRVVNPVWQWVKFFFRIAAGT